MKKFTWLLMVFALALGLMPAVYGQGADVESVCLITDVGRINDGTFNQYAYEGMVQAADDLDLESTYIESTAATDYEPNINTCLESDFDILITVGFLLGDATLAAAEDNPDTYFIGVDQFVEDGPENYVGIVFREDQSGFLAGALAALVAQEVEDSNTIAGVYGQEVPAVLKFRNGYERGAQFINPDINTLGVYIDDFYAPDRGASAAEQFIGEGASVIFGAGGQTGSGGILAAAQQEVWVIGVDQDEYFTTFGDGETPGAEYLISSAVKRVDRGVSEMIQALVDDLDDFPGGGNFILEIANDGIALAPKHDADIPDEIYEQVEQIREDLGAGEIETGVDPITGELLDESDMEAEGAEEGMEEPMETEEAEG